MVLLAGLLGAAVGAGTCSWIARRRRLRASGLAAIGTAALLNVSAAGNRSHAEHQVVFAASVVLIGCFLFAALATARRPRLSDPEEENQVSGN